MKKIFVFIFLCNLPAIIYAQSATLKFTDKSTLLPIPSVSVSFGNRPLAVADSLGIARFQLAAGNHDLTFSSTGYETVSEKISVPFTGIREIKMQPLQQSLEEITVISSTRNNQRIETSPLKVEVLGREEMEEENTIKPANIASILSDVSGIQIQQSSAVSGNANVRIQGLEGRYTQILKDGMPLYDGFSGGFCILSIPPLDLKQVELIKGAASTLYGGGAIGGLVNIISKKPALKQDGIFTLNRSTLNETNANAFLSKRYKTFGYTFFGGYNHQKATDVNKDGFSDVPQLDGFVVHPRLFFYPGENTTITTAYTGTFEKRNGGDMQVLKGNASSVHRYFEDNKTERHSGEFLIDHKMNGNKSLDFKSGISSFNRAVTTADNYFKGTQFDYFTELSLLIPYSKNSFVAGVNATGNRFKKTGGNPVLINDFLNNTIGAFAQNTWVVKENTNIEAGLRNDYHNKYGNFFLPRLALFHSFNEHWGTRAGFGMGYKIPDPLAPQIMEYDISRIMPLPTDIRAEKSTGYNAEVNYKKDWDNGNDFFINHAFFLTKISDPIVVTETSAGQASFSNGSKPVVTKGFDTYIRGKIDNWEIYCGYTFTVAERKYLNQNQFLPLTPKDRAAFTLVRDFEKQGWRIGLEGSYNGPQYRFDATRTPGYFFAAAMVEKKFGHYFSVVLNGENLFDYRQSKIESLYSGTVTNPGFKPLWAPIDGRVINLSVRIKPFN